MLLSRYKSNRPSYISLRKRSNSSTALSKLAYHTSKQTLKPLKDFNESEAKEEPIADEGLPGLITTVPITKHLYHTEQSFPKLDSLPSIISEDKISLFCQKCEACCVMCDFSDPESDTSAKVLKTSTLRELAEAINEESLKVLDSITLNSLFEMIITNLTRPIPPIPKKYLCFNDEPYIIEVNWPHLQIIYQIIKNYYTIIKQDDWYHQLRKVFNDLLYSADPNEREEILNFFLEYVKMYPDQLEPVLTEFSYKLIEYRSHNGLPFPVTIILRFYIEQVKQAPQVTQFLRDIWVTSIIPLISSQHTVTIYPVLMNVIDALTEKDPLIPKETLKIALHQYPEACPSKQISYFFFLNFLAEKLSPEDFEIMCQPLFRLYARCAVSSQHAKVIEASFKIWQNVKILQMIMDNTKLIFPIVFPAYQKIMKEHWKAATQDAALNAIKSMHDLDPFVYDELTQAQKKGLLSPHDGGFEMAIHKNWALIARTAAKTDKSVNLAKVLADIQINFSKMLETTKTEKKRAFSPPLNKPTIVMPKTPPPARF